MKAFTDLKQSKKLAEFLSIENADMWYWEWPTAPKYNNYEHPMFHKGSDIVNVPCWSLAALINVISKHSSRLEIILRADKKYNIFANFDKFIVFRKFVDIDNAIDVCVDMIETLYEQKLL